MRARGLEGGPFEQLPVELGHPFEDQGAKDRDGNFGRSAHGSSVP